MAIGAPGRVVVGPVVADLARGHRWGWDHTSIPRPGVGCFPWWEGSSRGCWPRRRRETEAGQHGSGSRFNEVLTSTTRVAVPDRGQEHHRLARHSPTSTTPSTGVAPVESSGVNRGPPVTRLRIWRLGVRIPGGAPAKPQLSGPATGKLALSDSPNCDHVGGQS
jgi:hypothetical protein